MPLTIHAHGSCASFSVEIRFLRNEPNFSAFYAVAMVTAHDLCASFCRFCEAKPIFPSVMCICHGHLFCRFCETNSIFRSTDICGCEHLSIRGDLQTLFPRIRLPDRL